MADSFGAYINQRLTGVPYRGYLRPRKNYQASIFFVFFFLFRCGKSRNWFRENKKQKNFSLYI